VLRPLNSGLRRHCLYFQLTLGNGAPAAGC
jgi:hypothetical protein